MIDIKWIDHSIDFFVILFADIGAAYFAITFFEARHADRKHTEKSLSELYKIASRMRNYLWAQRAGIPSNDNFCARISNELTDYDRSFETIKDDFLFWNFKVFRIFREHYDMIQTKTNEIYTSQPSFELRERVNSLIRNLDDFKKDIENELQPKKPWWKSFLG